MCAFAAQGLAQHIEINSASLIEIPFLVDGNSPSLWRDEKLHFYTSDGTPVKAQGSDQFSLSSTTKVGIDSSDHFAMWIESIWVDSDGSVYGWYHNEPSGVCPDGKLTAPRIGALVSYDGGNTFFDLGLVLTSGDLADCSSKNGFFAGGHGDFSVIPDRNLDYFYFFFTNYGGNPSSQGVAVARMAYGDRQAPAGAVWKYRNGEWSEPGLGGQLTPIFPAKVDWQQAGTNSYWGPAIHWNTSLESYVILMNHSCCEPGWPQEGVYISLNPDIANPTAWTEPVRILKDIGFGASYYPQVIGLGENETDTVVGPKARLYVHGKSKWEITFRKGPPYISGSDQTTYPWPLIPSDPLDQESFPRRSAAR